MTAKDTAFIKVLLAFIYIALVCILFYRPNEPATPEILIIRETTESHYGEQVLIVDYMVGGIATNAVFYPYQMDEYQAVIGHLKRSGRLRYASPMMEPLE